MKYSKSVILVILSLLASSLLAVNPSKAEFEKDILPIIKANCYSCHDDGKAKGDLSLEVFKTKKDVRRYYKISEQVFKKVLAGEMPPENSKKRLSKEDRALVTSWIRASLDDFYANAPPNPGRVTVRRLNRSEYNNVIRDLMRMNFKPAKDFPPDDSGYGFDNIGDVLSVSTILLEKYLSAAEKIAEQAVAVPPRGKSLPRARWTEFQKQYFKYPIPADNRRRIAEDFAQAFMRHAYRREVTREEIKAVLVLAKQAVDDSGSFEEGVRLAVQAVLISPHFLFRWELDGAPDNPGAIRSLNEFELASRLSFFMWSSQPDDQLLAFAHKGHLRKNLRQEVGRMLKDSKAESFVENFAGQWLQLRNLDVYQPDKKLFPSFTIELRNDMRRETEMLFAHIMRGDRSLLELLSAKYSFVNARLAAHYGIRNVRGEGFRSVSLRDISRGGILGHASILTITSDPNRTSPVKRGKWILANILGTPPPEPPAEVPELAAAQKASPTATLKEQLALHRENASCAICHRQMDPLGLGLENFDAVGRWREKDEGKLIDPQGILPNGDKFKSPLELIQVLGGRQEDFHRALAGKMLTYATGRGLQYYDRCAVDDIIKNMRKGENRFSVLVTEIVLSEPFRKKRGDGGQP